MRPDDYITVDSHPTRHKHKIEIPYAEYLVRLIVSDGVGVELFEEDIQILKRKEESDTDPRYADVTTDFITKFEKAAKIRPTGNNLFKVMALVFNDVNKEEV